MQHDQVLADPVHPLESNAIEREWFLNACTNYAPRTEGQFKF